MISSILLVVPFLGMIPTTDFKTVDNGKLQVRVDCKTGQFEISSGPLALRAIHSSIELPGEVTISSLNYRYHRVDFQPIRDALGSGTCITIRHTSPGNPELKQSVWVYQNAPEVLIRLDVQNSNGTVKMFPVLANLSSGFKHLTSSLYVPYDNDNYSRYSSQAGGRLSHEVGGLYDNQSRNGLIVGSIDHDTWKTGVQLSPRVSVIAGESGAETHDTQPHGMVTGVSVHSPRISVGFTQDWRKGLERFGDLNAQVRPPLKWAGGVPFGWNSWAAYKDKITPEGARVATDFIAHSKVLRNQGVAYVNLDSWWDIFKPEALRNFVQYAHGKGLKAGVYWTPFVAWGRLTDKVAGQESLTYGDLALKDSRGNPVPRLDGGAPLDPSHPGTLAMIDQKMRFFVDQGFDFVKLDFLSHGALEGKHFDPKIETGTQAYNLGMKRIVDDLSPSKIGRPFFISLSIAPLFPGGLGHSRRVSCDVFADIGASEYLLNAANYGWWTAGRLSPFNDPDHTVVYRSLGEMPTTESEAQTRITASVVAGGMILDSDDLKDSGASLRVGRLLLNPELLQVAKRGVPFIPIEGNSGDRGGSLFMRQDGKDVVFAAFNFDRKSSSQISIPFHRMGLSGEWESVDLWTGEHRTIRNDQKILLPPCGSTLLRLRVHSLIRRAATGKSQVP